MEGLTEQSELNIQKSNTLMSVNILKIFMKSQYLTYQLLFIQPVWSNYLFIEVHYFKESGLYVCICNMSDPLPDIASTVIIKVLYVQYI